MDLSVLGKDLSVYTKSEFPMEGQPCTPGHNKVRDRCIPTTEDANKVPSSPLKQSKPKSTIHIDAAERIKERASVGELNGGDVMDYTRSLYKLPRTKLKQVMSIFDLPVSSAVIDIGMELESRIRKAEKQKQSVPPKPYITKPNPESKPTNTTEPGDYVKPQPRAKPVPWNQITPAQAAKVLNAFVELEKTKVSGLIPIPDLLDMIPDMTREQVHGAINKLRHDRVLVGSSLEGRDLPTKRELDGGIREGDDSGPYKSNIIIGYVSRRKGLYVKSSPFKGRSWIKSLTLYGIKGQGQPCVQGETAANTGCIPAEGDGTKKPKSPKSNANKPESKKEKTPDANIPDMPEIPDMLKNDPDLSMDLDVAFDLQEMAYNDAVNGTTSLMNWEMDFSGETEESENEILYYRDALIDWVYANKNKGSGKEHQFKKEASFPKSPNLNLPENSKHNHSDIYTFNNLIKGAISDAFFGTDILSGSSNKHPNSKNHEALVKYENELSGWVDNNKIEASDGNLIDWDVTQTIPSIPYFDGMGEEELGLITSMLKSSMDDVNSGGDTLHDVKINSDVPHADELAKFKKKLQEWSDKTKNKFGTSKKEQGTDVPFKGTIQDSLDNHGMPVSKIPMEGWMIQKLQEAAIADVESGESFLDDVAIKPNYPKSIPELNAYREELKKWADSKKTKEESTDDYVNVSGWKKIGQQLGSNEGGQYEDEDGNKFYVKVAKSPDHAKNEVLAAKLYELAGAAVPEYKLWKEGNKTGTASAWEKHNPSSFDFDDKESAAENFAVHAWLANWDAIGDGMDNQVWVDTPDGRVLKTIDTGGSMIYRAQGGDKEFTDNVGEWDSMRTSSKNPNAVKVFGSMTNDQLIESAKKLHKVSDADIQAMVGKLGPKDDAFKKQLAKTLIDRKNWITGWADKAGKAVSVGEPIPAISKDGGSGAAALPPKPILPSSKWYVSDQNKVNKLYDAATNGDIAKLESLNTNPKSKNSIGLKIHAYKMALLSALKGGAIPADAANKPNGPSVKPSPFKKPKVQKPAKEESKTPEPDKSPIKIDTSSFPPPIPKPSKPVLSNATPKQIEAAEQFFSDMNKLYADEKMEYLNDPFTGYSNALVPYKQAKFTPDQQSALLKYKEALGASLYSDKLVELAKIGDIDILESFKVVVGYAESPIQSFKNELISNIYKQLNPPKPPKTYQGSLKALTKVYPRANGVPTSQKIGHFLKVDEPGVPNVDIPKIKIGTRDAKITDPKLKKLMVEPFYSMSAKTQYMLKDYTESGYHKINGNLRVGEVNNVPGLSETAKEFIEKSKPLPVGTFMTRKLTMHSTALAALESSVGSIIQEPGFSSTSIGDGWSGNVHFHITAMEGVKGLYSGDHWSKNPEEEEIVLPPGTRYWLKEVKKDQTIAGSSKKVTIIECYALPTVKEQCC